MRAIFIVLLLSSCQAASATVVPRCPCSCPATTTAPVAEALPPPSAESPAPPAKRATAHDYDAWLEYFDARTGKRQIFPIQSGKVVRIGRSTPADAKPDIDLGHVVDGDSVSRRHAEIVQREGKWMLFIQPNTTNRSFLNTEIVDRGSLNPLKADDEIQLGNVTLIFRTHAGE